jgi:uncharacterized Zn-binding protein involved in type VI secretion
MDQLYTEVPSASWGHCWRPPADPCNPSHASTQMVGGKAVFENDNYRITCGDDNQVLIENKHTGETYRAWGDPHMDVDGQHAFDFWGTTTLQLDDGTKVTIATTPWSCNGERTLASKVTITNGDYGVQIGGIDTNTTGDLAVHEARGWGRVLDAAVDDGNLLYENRCGRGFVAVDDFGCVRRVDQDYINATDLQNGGALAERYREAFRLLSGLLGIVFLGAFLRGLTGGCGGHERPAPAPPRDTPRIDFRLTMVRFDVSMQ